MTLDVSDTTRSHMVEKASVWSPTSQTIVKASWTNVISSCAEIQSEAGTNILRDRGANTGEEIATHGYKQTSK